MSGVVRLPSVDWLFVHDVTILRQSTTTIDAEGRWKTNLVSEPARGLVTVASRDEVARAASQGVDVQATCALPRDAQVTEADQLLVEGVDPYLDGQYRITGVHPTVAHLRVVLTRAVGYQTPPG